MISSISIKNFRCFEDLKVTDFERINLIAGKNNVGKTNLLEALTLVCQPNSNTVMEIQKYRNSTLLTKLENVKKLPERFWHSLFLDQKIGETIEIMSDITADKNLQLHITYNKNIDDNEVVHTFTDTKEIVEVLEKVLKSAPVKSMLRLTVTRNQEESDDIIIANNGMTAGKKNLKTYKDMDFFAVHSKFDSDELGFQYDNAVRDGYDDEVLNILKIFDDLIVDVRTLNGEITLKRKGKPQRMSLSSYGDATYKIVAYVLSIMYHPHGVILIDEIENGIHYTKQREFWEKLFILAEKFDVQIFATTHSDEMITAFKDATLAMQDITSGYFELLHSPVKNKIIANKVPISVLGYRMERNKPYRGE